MKFLERLEKITVYFQIRKIEAYLIAEAKKTKIFFIAIKGKRLQQSTLVSSMHRQQTDLIAIIDHKICHDKEIEYETIDAHTNITSPSWRNTKSVAADSSGTNINQKVE